MLLDDIARRLEDSDIGLSGEDIFKGHVPGPAQPKALVIREYPGPAPMRAGGGIAAEDCRVQVMCRDADYRDARYTAELVYQALDGTHDEVINGTRYLWIEALGPPASLGRDENGLSQVYCNYRVMKELTTP